jgi:hypothetical protein
MRKALRINKRIGYTFKYNKEDFWRERQANEIFGVALVPAYS